MRGQYQYIHTFTGSAPLPIFEKLFLGGEYSVRGFDIRTIGPADPTTGLVLGGNKSLLFNVEEQISIAGPVRLIFFYDAGQVQDGPNVITPPAFVPAGGLIGAYVKPGQSFRWQDFKTSTGAEVRFFMPVLNVPFRLIFAYNPAAQRRAGQHAAAAERLPVPLRGRLDVLSRAAARRKSGNNRGLCPSHERNQRNERSCHCRVARPAC